MNRYRIELQSQKYGYYEIQTTAKDLKDADQYATKRARIAAKFDNDEVQVRNVIQIEVIESPFRNPRDMLICRVLESVNGQFIIRIMQANDFEHPNKIGIFFSNTPTLQCSCKKGIELSLGQLKPGTALRAGS